MSWFIKDYELLFALQGQEGRVSPISVTLMWNLPPLILKLTRKIISNERQNHNHSLELFCLSEKGGKKNMKQNIYPTILLRLIVPMKVWTVMFQCFTVKGPYPWWPCSIFSTKKKYGTSTVLLFPKVLFTKQSLCWLKARCPFIVWVSLEFFFFALL